MVFEAKNAYFETENKINESIQDKIDAKKIEINQLTKKNLKKLRVDILHSNSFLRIRDKNGKIIGKLKDNQIVDFNGERKVINYKGKQKIFLGIDFKKQDKIIKGFVAADYVKGEITKIDKKEHSIFTQDVAPKKEKDKKTPLNQNLTPKLDKEITTENISSKKEVKENPTSYNSIGYIENGRNYIIGKDGTPQLVEFDNLPPETKEKLERYQEILRKVENINLLLNALKQDGKNIKYYQDNLNKAINEFDPNSLGQSLIKIDNIINEIIKNFDIKNIDLTNKLSVLNYIRNEIGNYNLVNNVIINQEFFNLIKKLSPEEFQEFISNPDKTRIEKIVGKDEAQKITEKVIEKKSEALKYWNEQQDKLIKKYPNINIKELKDNIINAFVGNYTKNLIMNSYIEKNLTNEIGYLIKGTEYNGKGNDFIDLYADINGIGDYDFADKTWDWGKETFIFIATEIVALAAGALTMGAGTVAVNSLVYGYRGYRGIKWLQRGAKIADLSLKGGKYIKGGRSIILGYRAGRFASMSAIEGASFYAGYGAAQSLIEGKNMYSIEGLAESIAFTAAFRALNGLYKITGLELKSDIPLKEQKLKLTTQLAIEGTTLGALGLQFQGILFEPGEWDAETIIQAFTMATLFKITGRLTSKDKIKFKKNKDKIEVLKEENKIEAPKNKQNHKWSKDINPSKPSLSKEKAIKSNEKQDILTKKLHKLFSQKFEKHFQDKNKLILKNESRKEIVISKTTDGRYLISGDDIIYSKRELLEKIKKSYPKFEKTFLKTKTKEEYNMIVNNKETLITNRDIFSLIKGKERITENGLEIKDGKNWRLANEEEIKNFLNNNPKIEKLLSRSIEKQIEREIKDKGLKEALLKNKKKILKEIFLGKAYFNLWLPGLYTISQIDDYKNIDIGKFAETFAVTYIASAGINGAYLTLSTGAKFLLTTKPVKTGIDFLKKHYGKITFAGAFGTGVYLYHIDE